MKYLDLYEDLNLIGTVEKIKQNCGVFLAETGGYPPLYRGITYANQKPKFGTEITEYMSHIDFREERDPKIANPTFFFAMNDYLKHSGFDAVRNNSDVFTGNQLIASYYSNIREADICFPLDGYSYTWNPKVLDYLVDFDENEDPDLIKTAKERLINMGLSFSYIHSGGDIISYSPELAAELWWEQIGDHYTDMGLKQAIESKNEILITGSNGYYVIPGEYEKQLLDML